MAGKFAIITTMVLNTTGYMNGVNKASAATAAMGKKLEAAGSAVTGTMGQLGGIVGQIGGSIGTLASAATGIGLITAAVTVLIKALKSAKENMDLYLKSASKSKQGTGAFFQDAKEIQKQTTKRARGGVRAEQDIITETMAQAAKIYNSLLSETNEEKKKILQSTLDQLFAENQAAKVQLIANAEVKKNSIGWENRIIIQAKARKLLLDEALLTKEIAKNQVGFAETEAKLVGLRETIVNATTTELEKDKAMEDFRILAEEHLKKRVGLIDREIEQVKVRGELEGTQKEAGYKILELQTEKFNLEKEYNLQLVKADRLQTRLTKLDVARAKAAEDKLKAEEKYQQLLQSEQDRAKVLAVGNDDFAIKKQELLNETQRKQEEARKTITDNKKLNEYLSILAGNYYLELENLKTDHEKKTLEDAKKKVEDAKDEELKINKQMIEDKKAMNDAQFAGKKITEEQYLKNIIDIEKQNMETSAAEKIKIEAETQAQILDIKKKAIEDEQQLRQNLLDTIIGSTLQSLDGISQMQNNAKESELKAAGKNAIAKERIERKYAEKQKRIALAQAIINGAVAVSKAWSQLGIYGWIGALAVTAANAIQIGAIASQSFAQGGIVSGPTNALIGEYRGAKSNPEVVAPLSRLTELLGLGGGGKVTFEIQGDALVGVLNNYTRKINSYA